MSFDYHRFLVDRWGDPDKVVAFLRTYGHPVERATANMWFRRRSVPADSFALLLALLEVENGAPVSVAGYLS